MEKPKLTIGMAVYEDFDGVCFTVQHLRAFHASEDYDTEILVVDNNPKSQHGETTKNFCANAGVKYVPYPENTGTSQTRNLVFQKASGEYVLCMDSHVFFMPGAVRALMDYYAENPDTPNLLQGPLVYDNYKSISTHFTDEWRSEMWGTWGLDQRVWKNEEPLQSFDNLMDIVSDVPFEIFAQGLGVFSCRKQSWLGFNEHFRGFGGEECYIHEKFRQAGAECLCIPKLLWWHRFARPNGVPYPLTPWNKVRNYVLGHIELGRDMEPVRRHFVDGVNSDGTPARGLDANGKPLSGSIPASEWQELMEDPVSPLPPSALKRKDAREVAWQNGDRQSCGTCGGKTGSLDELYKKACETPSDINEHVEKFKELASQVEHVTDFSMRHDGSSIGLLAGKPKKMVSYFDKKTQGIARLEMVSMELEDTEFRFIPGNSLSVEIEETDLLFLDTVHTAEHLLKELVKHAAKVRRWIVVHDTQIFGERGENGKAGVMAGLRKFMKDNPHWSVYYHAPKNNGLTVISCQESDKKTLPGLIQMGKNYAKAVAAHVADGAKKTPEDVYEKRLEMCWTCDQRNGERCGACGCTILDKAKWNEQQCPLGYWAEIKQLDGAK